MTNPIKLSILISDAMNGLVKTKDAKAVLSSWITKQYVYRGEYTTPLLTDEQFERSPKVTVVEDISKPNAKVMASSKPSQVIGRAMSLQAMAFHAAMIKVKGFQYAKGHLVASLESSDFSFFEKTVEFGKKLTTWPFSIGGINAFSQELGTNVYANSIDNFDGLFVTVELHEDCVDGDAAYPFDGSGFSVEAINEAINEVVKAESLIDSKASEAQTNALNYMLNEYTNGKVPTFVGLVSDYEDAKDTATKALDKITELQADLKKEKSKVIPPLAAPMVLEQSDEIPSGSTSVVNAQIVFDITDPRLDFDVLTYQWDSHNRHVPKAIDSYHFDVEILMMFLHSINHKERSWFRGHTGTGKTTFQEQTMARLGKMCFRLSCDVGVESYHIVGSNGVVIKDGKSITSFVEGILPQAMELPSHFIIDEADALRPDIAYLFQPVLEGQALRLNEDGGRLVYPHSEFTIGATANTGGQGDDTSLYAAAVKIQSTAQINRYNHFFEVDYMSAADEVAVVRQVIPNLSDASAANLEVFLKDFRKGFQDGTITMPISPRNSITIARFCASFEDKMGAGDVFRAGVKSNITMRCSDMDKARVNELVERIARGATLEQTTNTLNDETPF